MVKVSSKKPTSQAFLMQNERVELGRVNIEMMNQILTEDIAKATADQLALLMKKKKLKTQLQVKSETKGSTLWNEEAERIVFERNLGNSEILGQHRWREVFEPCCHICQKHNYVVFIWNTKVSTL